LCCNVSLAVVLSFWQRDYNHLRSALRRKRQHLLAMNPIIIHDNARAHTADAMKELLRRWWWEILEHSTYLHDTSLWGYDLFAKMETPPREIRYNSREEIFHALALSLLDINRSECLDSVRRLPQIWPKVVRMGGDYIERINFDCFR
jgi:hypothetical protein